MLALYVLVVGCHVAHDVARGRPTLERWPGLPTREEFFVPVARVAGAAIWILGPIVAMRLVADPAEGSGLLFWSLLGLGGYLVPMVIARVAVRETFLAGHPIAVVMSLFRTWKSYSIASIPFFLAVVALGVSFAAPFQIEAVIAPIAVYLFLVAFAVLGRFYALNEAKLRIRRGATAEGAEGSEEPTDDAGKAASAD